MAQFEIKPVEGESYKDRQWGYVIERGGAPAWHVTTGGTGDCWNIEAADDMDDPDVIAMHVCDLDDLIEALQALRASDAHTAHVASWSFP